jgi:rfaE bifunctional protein kinase chain/domain
MATEWETLSPEFIRQEIAKKKFCVVGDVIIDHYRMLKATRLSPEAPVPVFQPTSEKFIAGGAANVANNLMAMGAGKVTLVAAVGEDWDSYWPRTRCSCETRVVKVEGRMTVVKERLLAKSQHIARIDLSEQPAVSERDSAAVADKAADALGEADAFVFSDYAHGAMPKSMVLSVGKKLRGGKPMVVDSKAKDTVSKYTGFTIALPTFKDAVNFTGMYDYEEVDVAKFLLKSMHLQAMGLKMGPKGILLMTQKGPEIFPATRADEEIVDVTGAGDTVAAMTTIGLSLGMSFESCMWLSNIAAGIVVHKQGTATASLDEIVFSANDALRRKKNG